MKRINIVIRCLSLLLLIATFAACVSTRAHESEGKHVDDSDIKIIETK